ncbi:MAG: hypothetical protein WAV38_14700, partial [Xanthobacteraceae bacterium]
MIRRFALLQTFVAVAPAGKMKRAANELALTPGVRQRSSAPTRRRHRVGSTAPESDPQMCRRSAPFRLLSISRKQSARYCASADKLGNGA